VNRQVFREVLRGINRRVIKSILLYRLPGYGPVTGFNSYILHHSNSIFMKYFVLLIYLYKIPFFLFLFFSDI